MPAHNYHKFTAMDTREDAARGLFVPRTALCRPERHLPSACVRIRLLWRYTPSKTLRRSKRDVLPLWACNQVGREERTEVWKIGGSVWESNPPRTGVARPPRGFEDREDHQAPSAPMRGGNPQMTQICTDYCLN